MDATSITVTSINDPTLIPNAQYTNGHSIPTLVKLK